MCIYYNTISGACAHCQTDPLRIPTSNSLPNTPLPSTKYIYSLSKREITKPQKVSQGGDHVLTNKLDPVISSGWPSPMASSKVGATSPRTPCCFLRLHPAGALAMTNGTLLVVWDVLGFPCSLSISSAFLYRCVSFCGKAEEDTWFRN